MPEPYRPVSTRQAQSGLQLALSTVVRPNALVMAWRWRYETALAAGLALPALFSGPTIGVVGMLAAAVTLAATLAIPGGRRLAAACAWHIITPHRVRTGCAQAWIHSRTGRLPFIVLTTSEPFGERVRLWCRAGISADDFEAARSRLAAACWALDVQVVRSLRYAHLVTLDVIRKHDCRQPIRARLWHRGDSATEISLDHDDQLPEPAPAPPLPGLGEWPIGPAPGTDGAAQWN